MTQKAIKTELPLLDRGGGRGGERGGKKKGDLEKEREVEREVRNRRLVWRGSGISKQPPTLSRSLKPQTFSGVFVCVIFVCIRACLCVCIIQ